MRDLRKKQQYFLEYISLQNERIAHKIQKLENCAVAEAEKKQRILKSLLNLQMDLLVAEFSIGATRDELYRVHRDCCKTAISVRSTDYENMLRLLALGIILDNPDDVCSLVKAHEAFINKDKLLHCFATYACTGNIDWSGDFLVPSVYSPLDQVFSANNKKCKESALLEYLNTWYLSCEGAAWYDTLDNPYDVYTGYWSFESAALALILELDTSKFTTNEYFPKL